MAEFTSYKKGSKVDWGANLKEGQKLERDQIQLGAILRIADATEHMASNHISLIERIKTLEKDSEYWMNKYYSEVDRHQHTKASRKAYRGHVTRLKNKSNG